MRKFRYGGLPGAACVALVTLAACGREGQDEMSWARAALERNTGVEVVAADSQSRTFTVRLRDTGELRTVRADQLVGAPSLAAAGSTAATAQPPAASGTSAVAGNVATAAPARAPAAQAESAGAGHDTAAAATPPAPAQPSALLPQTAPPIEEAPGRVLSAGPGYTIKAAPPAGAPSRVRDRDVTSAALERRHEPIVCQGARLLHIDNRNLVFDGDAVSAEDGCELHITNSHISAGGIGVLVRAANVHIDNSLIEGEQGSIDASQGAQVYAASSRFRGLSRRVDTAALHDLGGNVWN
jgi:hypothetical protein